MSIYGGRLNHGSKKSIPHFEGKNNPVKHILALCSILWQGNRGKVNEKAGRQHALNVLPRYAAQCRIAAKRCFTASWCLVAFNRPGSVKQCQDMLHKHCLRGGKITVIFSCDLSGLGRLGWVFVLDQILPHLVHADPGDRGIIGLAIHVQHIFHVVDKVPILFFRKTPGFFEPRLQLVFFNACLTVSGLICSTYSNFTIRSARSSNVQR